MDHTPGPPESTTRRAVVTAAGVTGLGAVLAACAGTGTDAPAGGGAPQPGVSGQQLARTADIPQGGGRIFSTAQVVVTQPTAGRFKAFSAICTHMGCPLSEIKDGTIDCTCHGSQFRITDGSVARGPAAQPLPAVKITVQGGEIKLA